MDVHADTTKQAPIEGVDAAAALLGPTVNVDGTTLPPLAYTSQAFFDREVEKIFKADWLCVGHISQVPGDGDYFTIDLLGDPAIVVRDKTQIRVLSSVCRHRWVPVVSGQGNARAFTCPFHKWTYRLDGALLGAPLMDGTDLARSSCRLPEYRSEVVDELGLIFVSFSTSVAPISERLASLCERARQEGWGLKDQLVISDQPMMNNFNWKIQAETYMECYHHLGGHLETLEKVFPAALSGPEPDHGAWSVCHIRLTDRLDRLSETERATADALAPGGGPGDTVGHLVMIYPLTLITVMPGGCDLRFLRPIGPARTAARVLATRDGAEVAQPGFEQWLEEFNAGWDVINKEDNDMNDLQQVGVSSSRAAPGRLSRLEACVGYLANYVRRQITA